MIKRFGYGRDYANNIGAPTIKELPDGKYVLHSDYAALLSHNNLQAAQLQKQAHEMAAIGAGGVSGVRVTGQAAYSDVASDGGMDPRNEQAQEDCDTPYNLGWQSGWDAHKRANPEPTKPDPVMAGDEREAFEQWHRNKFRTNSDSGQPTRDIHNSVYDDEYGPAHQQQLWEAWQASSKRIQPASGEDAKLLDWLVTGLFERKWDGTIGSPSEWHLRGDWRHIIQHMKGPDIRAAITAAMQQEPQP